MPTAEFAAYVGLDWGDQKHALAWTADTSKTAPQTGTLVNSPEALHAWLQELGQRFAGRPVALAVETSRGPLIHLFGAYPWLTVYPIHPATSARYRTAFKPSGAKDDLPDALLLLELVRDLRHKLRPLQLPEAATRQLAALVQLRRVREGTHLEEDHMRNRQLIVRWLIRHTHAVQERWRDGRTFYVVTDVHGFHLGVGTLLAEAQDEVIASFLGPLDGRAVLDVGTGRTALPRTACLVHRS